MSAEKGKIYAFWLDFFRTAGILPSYDSKYALVFEDNRIKPDMLLDLTKECLRDMEITAMGDIIAILRHAKVAHEQSKTLAFGKPESTAVTTTPTAPSASQISEPPKSVVVAAKSSEKVTTTTPTLAPSNIASKDQGKSTGALTVSNKTARSVLERRGMEQVTTAAVPKDTEKQPNKVPKRFIIVDRESSSESDVPEKRPRELPAPKKKNTVMEGVSAPLNNRLGPSVSVEKGKGTETKGVFARLGRSSDGNPCISGEATIIRPGASASVSKPSSNEGSSVFGRLGGRGSGAQNDSEPTSSRRLSEGDRRRDDSEPRREDTRKVGNRNDNDRNDRRITLRQKSPEHTQQRSIVTRVDRDYQQTRDRERNPPIRSEITCTTSQGLKYTRPEANVSSRLGSARDDLRGRRKVVATSSIKNSGDLRVGQVLQTTRFQRSDGKSVVQRVIVKRVPKVSMRFRRDRSPDAELESDESLSRLLDEDD